MTHQFIILLCDRVILHTTYFDERSIREMMTGILDNDENDDKDYPIMDLTAITGPGGHNTERFHHRLVFTSKI
jgi:hypothetical protein